MIKAARDAAVRFEGMFLTPRQAGALPPAIDRCDPACANIARTDVHIARLRTEIAQLGEEIAGPLKPTPLRERLRQRLTALQALASRHQRTPITLTRPDTGPAASSD